MIKCRWPAGLLTIALLATVIAANASSERVGRAFGPGDRVLLDAHNSYPEAGRWADRIDRALSTGTPLAIEQDLYWHRDSITGAFDIVWIARSRRTAVTRGH